MLETSLPGVFAVGDVGWGNVKRVASAVGEGSMVVRLVHNVLAESYEAAETSSLGRYERNVICGDALAANKAGRVSGHYLATSSQRGLLLTFSITVRGILARSVSASRSQLATPSWHKFQSPHLRPFSRPVWKQRRGILTHVVQEG
jgi:hypothetical protein